MARGIRRFFTGEHTDDSVIGRVGRVTGTVGPGLVGEVTLPVRGGSEAFTAYPYIGTETIPTGTQVVVHEYAQPRTVYVTAAL